MPTYPLNTGWDKIPEKDYCNLHKYCCYNQKYLQKYIAIRSGLQKKEHCIALKILHGTTFMPKMEGFEAIKKIRWELPGMGMKFIHRNLSGAKSASYKYNISPLSAGRDRFSPAEFRTHSRGLGLGPLGGNTTLHWVALACSCSHTGFLVPPPHAITVSM